MALVAYFRCIDRMDRMGARCQPTLGSMDRTLQYWWRALLQTRVGAHDTAVGAQPPAAPTPLIRLWFWSAAVAIMCGAMSNLARFAQWACARVGHLIPQRRCASYREAQAHDKKVRKALGKRNLELA